MKDKKDHLISRTEFLNRSKAACCLGILGGIPRLNSQPNEYENIKAEGRTLGKTGIPVAPLGFGASHVKDPALIKYAINKGLRFIDTGRVYLGGQNEFILGRVLKDLSQEMVIQTKVGINIMKNVPDLNASKAGDKVRNILEMELKTSLEALKRDTIDILLLHRSSVNALVHHEEVMDFFQKAKKDGKIRACGFSSHTNQVELLAAANKSMFYDVVMVPFNPKGSYVNARSNRGGSWDQSALEPELKKALTNGIGIVAMKTCSGGPYAPEAGASPSFKEGLKWVTKKSYIGIAAVSMGTYQEIDENTSLL
ncbi:hypothetical protein BVY01_05145 [bacterium I07]|nr:hypothetical protein BVY01_05145 [bacterium I07]